MNDATSNKQSEFEGLPNITFRQLEVFKLVCREESYANAALELRSTRANIKRVCDDFEKAVGRPLLEDGPDRTLKPTVFARGLLDQIAPLTRGLRRLEESVKHLHEEGRILRFATTGEFFKGGLFTDFLGRLQISDTFRPCFLRIETTRFRTALLNAECDVYCGIGLNSSDRLDQVDLGAIPWQLVPGKKFRGKLPSKPSELPKDKWWISDTGEAECTENLIEEFRRLGAKGGNILAGSSNSHPEGDGIVFVPDATAKQDAASPWPCYRFSAVLRKHHPYSELHPRLTSASVS